MKVGILDLLTSSAPSRWSPERVGYFLITKQLVSIVPQAIAVWCRQLSHQVYYATYFGQSDPKRLLPDGLDVVFISSYSQASALAYALAKLYRKEGTLTVLGGPHAKSFPQDSVRFFDLVVRECDQTLVADILSGIFDPGTIISSGRTLTDIPSVEERMPEINASVFTHGRRYLSTTIPMLTSVGCPYHCDFCIDWDNPYVLLPLDRLEADLRYLSTSFSGVRIGFHDPNFGVKFDQVLNVLETIPEKSRNPFVMESTLSLLRGPRLQRLRDSNCVYLAPGVEAWSGYSNKAGTGSASGSQKVDQLVEHFELLHEYVKGLGANFIFGLDVDQGEEPVELTKEFMNRTPFVWPYFNIPVPYGETPFHDQYLREHRILTAMPLAFYYTPYLVTTLKHYSPIDYYEKMIDLTTYSATKAMFWRRLRSTSNWPVRTLMTIRCFGAAHKVKDFRRILKLLTEDPQFRAFHEGESQVLPEFYHHEFERMLGRYAPLLSRADHTPDLSPSVPALPRGAQVGSS